MLATISIALAALTPGGVPRLSRRGVTAGALLSVPALLRPERAAAQPQAEFQALNERQAQLEALAAKLKSEGVGGLRGDRSDDAVVVLQTITVQQGDTARLLQRAADGMTLLDEGQLSKARELAGRFATELESVRQGCRELAPSKQLAGTEAAGQALGDFLALATTRYTVPAYVAPALYSSDQKVFAAQYFGFLSCEGQGLERIPGSNSCKDAPKGKNMNPFPTKKFLDFDFLTGEKLK